jgi:hypothetical protein
MPFFTPLAPDIRRSSFPPAAYREIIASIYAACGLDREIHEPLGRVSTDDLPERTTLSVSVMNGARFAKIRIGAYGRNSLSEVFNLIEDLHRHHVKVLRLEMPLNDPITAQWYWPPCSHHASEYFPLPPRERSKARGRR